MIADVRDVDSVQFPVCFCAQYNAEFDGDEVHLHP
jgi:DNA-directed RNA polymerase beta' subunit